MRSSRNIIYSTNNNYVNSCPTPNINVNAQQGPTGPEGPTGYTGDTGYTGYTGDTGPTGPNAIYQNLALNNLYFPYDPLDPLLSLDYAPTIHIYGTGGVSGSFIQMYDSVVGNTSETIFNLTSENNGNNDYSLLTMGNGINTKNITIDGNVGEISANTFSGSTGSFNYVKGGTASFNYVTGGTASFNYVTGGTASFNYLNLSDTSTKNIDITPQTITFSNSSQTYSTRAQLISDSGNIQTTGSLISTNGNLAGASVVTAPYTQVNNSNIYLYTTGAGSPAQLKGIELDASGDIYLYDTNPSNVSYGSSSCEMRMGSDHVLSINNIATVPVTTIALSGNATTSNSGNVILYNGQASKTVVIEGVSNGSGNITLYDGATPGNPATIILDGSDSIITTNSIRPQDLESTITIGDAYGTNTCIMTYTPSNGILKFYSLIGGMNDENINICTTENASALNQGGYITLVGYISVKDLAGNIRIQIHGSDGNIYLKDTNANNTIQLSSNDGSINLYNANSTTPSITLDGINGFISYPKQTTYTLGSMNPTISGVVCNFNNTFTTFNLIGTSPTIVPGQYNLVLAQTSTLSSIGGVSIDISYSTTTTINNYISLMVLASSSSITGGGWANSALSGNNYLIASSSNVLLPPVSSQTPKTCFFSITSTITITPDKPFISILLGIKSLGGSVTIYNNPSLPIYVPTPGYDPATDTTIQLIPVS